MLHPCRLPSSTSQLLAEFYSICGCRICTSVGYLPRSVFNFVFRFLASCSFFVQSLYRASAPEPPRPHLQLPTHLVLVASSCPRRVALALHHLRHLGATSPPCCSIFPPCCAIFRLILATGVPFITLVGLTLDVLAPYLPGLTQLPQKRGESHVEFSWQGAQPQTPPVTSRFRWMRAEDGRYVAPPSVIASVDVSQARQSIGHQRCFPLKSKLFDCFMSVCIVTLILSAQDEACQQAETFNHQQRERQEYAFGCSPAPFSLFLARFGLLPFHLHSICLQIRGLYLV